MAAEGILAAKVTLEEESYPMSFEDWRCRGLSGIWAGSSYPPVPSYTGRVLEEGLVEHVGEVMGWETCRGVVLVCDVSFWLVINKHLSPYHVELVVIFRFFTI